MGPAWVSCDSNRLHLDQAYKRYADADTCNIDVADADANGHPDGNTDANADANAYSDANAAANGA